MLLAMGMNFTAEAFTVSENSENVAVSPKKKATKKMTKKTTSKTAMKTSAETMTAAAADTSVTSSKAASSTGSGNLLGGILSAIGGGSSSSSTNSILSGLTAIFDATKGATSERIIGTWTYTEPAVVFTSSNVLKSIGGKVASKTIESKLQTQFNKVGIKKGMMKMTFDKDGNFTQTLGSKSVSGTYTVKDCNIILNYTGGIKQLVGTTQLSGNDLLIVMDASKLLKYTSVISSMTGNTTLKTLGSLIGSTDGMQVGLKFDK